MKEQPMVLSDYSPRSELIVEEHPVSNPRYPVIDVHTHFDLAAEGDRRDKKEKIDGMVNRLKEYGVRQVVNLIGSHEVNMDDIMDTAERYGDFFITFGTVDVTRLGEPDFASYVRHTLKDFCRKGVCGIKFFKDVSLKWKDPQGNYIAIDDERLEVIWDAAAEWNMPVLAHIADPVAFFKPADRYNERYEELTEYPEWSFCRSEFYTFPQLLEMQEKLLDRNPDTTFIIPHGGSYTENLGYVSKCLDRYPNMYIDTAARLGEFGRQPYTSGKFFRKYQDRILFGTDGCPVSADYPNYYRFFETLDEYFDYYPSEIPRQGRWKIYGIGLEDEVLRKIYYGNAEKVLKRH